MTGQELSGEVSAHTVDLELSDSRTEKLSPGPMPTAGRDVKLAFELDRPECTDWAGQEGAVALAMREITHTHTHTEPKVMTALEPNTVLTPYAYTHSPSHTSLESGEKEVI